MPLAFVGVGVFGYFQANAAPSDHCIDVAQHHTQNVDVSELAGLQTWNAFYYSCLLFSMQ